MSKHRDLDTKNWRGDHRVEEWLITLVVWVCNKRNACGQELGASGLNNDISPTIYAVKGERVIGARHRSILELGLRNCGTEINIPERWRLRLVRLTARQHPHKTALRCALRSPPDRGVCKRPVNREAYVSPEFFELLLVLKYQLIT
ncbi:unannotated protein [freshwater metagenome]|uniref:Unannotated protein n=1 Tax=freshwater metagenome TaxID=449393 RepID=A0A6J6XA77_9ZZZZ